MNSLEPHTNHNTLILVPSLQEHGQRLICKHVYKQKTAKTVYIVYIQYTVCTVNSTKADTQGTAPITKPFKTLQIELALSLKKTTARLIVLHFVVALFEGVPTKARQF